MANPGPPTLHSHLIFLQALYEDTRSPPDLVSLWEDDVTRMRHSHFQILHALYQKRRAIAAQQGQQEQHDEEARKRRESLFPSSIRDFRSKPKDVQQRAARFLVLGDGARQDRMLAEYGWAWRQVKPLQEEMVKHVSGYAAFWGVCSLIDSLNSQSSKLRYRHLLLSSM